MKSNFITPTKAIILCLALTNSLQAIPEQTARHLVTYTETAMDYATANITYAIKSYITPTNPQGLLGIQRKRSAPIGLTNIQAKQIIKLATENLQDVLNKMSITIQSNTERTSKSQ